MSWYVVDPSIFYARGFNNVVNLDDSIINKHTMRQILVNEVFPNVNLPPGQLPNIPVFDISYFPTERGPYNFDLTPSNYTAGVDPISGKLNNPQSRWGGIMRTLTTNDFEAANIEFIQFWMMDPFNEDSDNSTGGDFYINLGNVSEDLLRDGRKSFENGLPPDGDFVANSNALEYTEWGVVPNTQAIVNAFDNNLASREHQDVGFDGLPDEKERNYFDDYISTAQNYIADPLVLQQILTDPSSDNYAYYRDDEYTPQTNIIDRYKNYNSPDGNSPTSEMSDTMNIDRYPTSASTLPNIEDINLDNNLSETESYFQYKIELDPNNMQIGKNYITDIYEPPSSSLPNGKSIKWYQFRVPVAEFSKRINDIQDFRSIRFLSLIHI